MRYIVAVKKKMAETIMIDAPDGTGSSSSIGKTVPIKHAMVASKDESNTKLPIRLVRRRAVAPGISSNAPTNTAPIIFTAAMVTNVIIMTNK